MTCYAKSNFRKIYELVSHGKVSCDLLFSKDEPITLNRTIVPFYDNTVLTIRDCSSSFNTVTDWTCKEKKLKTIQMNLINKMITQNPIDIDGNQIMYACTAKYMGINLDFKIWWKDHIKNETSRPELLINNEILLY